MKAGPMDAGTILREVRTKLGITTREVADFSKAIADREGNELFLLSGPWLTQIENEKAALPSIYKLFTLASLYGLSISQILSFYGIDTKKINEYHLDIAAAKKDLAEYRPGRQLTSLDVRIRFDSAPSLSNTNLVSRMVGPSGRAAVEFAEHFDTRGRLYGFVGMKDYTLYPLIRPGSFVEINPEVKTPKLEPVRSEFERPIYFIDLRHECACGWCDLVEDKLVVLAHPLSPARTRIFTLNKEAEVIGQVTGVASRIVLSLPEPAEEPSLLAKHSPAG